MPHAAEDGSTALALALSYAACGIRVLPIKPGTKRPPMNEWVEAATTDPDMIRNWWTEPLYRDHGVGLVLGRQPDGRMLFALDVDEHDPSQSGSETLADWEVTHGSLPDTPRSITGSGGLHLLFDAGEGVEVRNSKPGVGIDVRGEGGQIVVAPSIHPTTGVLYAWEDGYAPWERGVALAPPWLLDLVATKAVGHSPQPSAPLPPRFADPDESDSPSEWLRERWDWELQLRDAGWTEHHADRSGSTYWTRPGKDRREGESAHLFPGGPFVVFSTDASVAGLHAVGTTNRDGSVSVSPIEFYAAQRHGGNLSDAARAVRLMMSPPDSRLSAPLGDDLGIVNWDALFSGGDVEDAMVEGMVFPGRWTGFIAPPKEGKSTFALNLAHCLARGIDPFDGSSVDKRMVLYIDAEMGRIDMMDRLTDLGLGVGDLGNLIYTDLPRKLDTVEGATWLRHVVDRHDPALVVFDGLNGLVSGAEKDDTPWRLLYEHSIFPLKQRGAAVVSADNMGKDESLGARGSSVKHDKADAIIKVKRTEVGSKLTTLFRRTGSYLMEAEFVVTGLTTTDPITYRPFGTTGMAMVPGASELYPLVKKLIDAGAEPKLSVKKAGALLRQAGHQIDNGVLAKAVKWRKAGNELPDDWEQQAARRLSTSAEPQKPW